MRKVLVADSSSIIPFVLERILGKHGYRVLFVRHARDLIAQVKEVLPDIIFLEAEIDHGKGHKICDYLHRQPETRSIPIILLTRLADAHKHKLEDWPGVHRLLRKPLSSKKVRESVESIQFTDTQEFEALIKRQDAG